MSQSIDVPPAAPLGAGRVAQVALVVKDLEEVAAKYARLLGVAAPEVVDSGDSEVTGTVYQGAPAPRAGCRMAFFEIGPGMQLELIEPNGEPSAWQDYLDRHGEGVHHLAFAVKDTSSRLSAAGADFGWATIQRGKYGDGSGEYAYLDSFGDLKVYVETLESFAALEVATPLADSATSAASAPFSADWRKLGPGQVSRLHIYDAASGQDRVVYETDAAVIEAPNWTVDGTGIVFNQDGELHALDLASGEARLIDSGIRGAYNNDHVLDPDGRHIFATAEDGHIYQVPLTGGAARRVTPDSDGLAVHYLHGVSPDGRTLLHIGGPARAQGAVYNVYALDLASGRSTALTYSGRPYDGAEFSPDAAWIYFNAEPEGSAAGHAQIFRMRPDGSGTEQLTSDGRVNWFPHLSPDGRSLVYISFPPGTTGHPADRPVQLVVADPLARSESVRLDLFGGQGTINVNSWAPDSRRFAYVDYPVDAAELAESAPSTGTAAGDAAVPVEVGGSVPVADHAANPIANEAAVRVDGGIPVHSSAPVPLDYPVDAAELAESAPTTGMAVGDAAVPAVSHGPVAVAGDAAAPAARPAGPDPAASTRPDPAAQPAGPGGPDPATRPGGPAGPDPAASSIRFPARSVDDRRVGPGFDPGARTALGTTRLMVSPICIGSGALGSVPNLFGYETPADRAVETIMAAFATALNFIDTSAGYSGGEAERRIGRGIVQNGGLPPGWVLATKADPDPVTGRFDGPAVRRSVLGSLERLGLDRLDLLYLHDPERIAFGDAMAAGGPVEALLALRAEGLVSHLGVAGAPVGTMMRYARTGHFEVLLTHNRYTLLDRTAEPLIAEAHALGLGVVQGAPFGGGVLAKGLDVFDTYAYVPMTSATRRHAADLAAICAEAGVPLGAAALQFPLRDPRIASVAVGVTRPERLTQTFEWASWPVPADVWSAIMAACGRDAGLDNSAR
ncbi:MAG: aldo/keto reductase [Bifidobacteriaceae bacterium]|jgi:D-threo-aldose 1-dehydrogenase|nr:aldo/keto reductase [Bifidobacteriaceae bacterium]